MSRKKGEGNQRKRMMDGRAAAPLSTIYKCHSVSSRERRVKFPSCAAAACTIVFAAACVCAIHSPHTVLHRCPDPSQKLPRVRSQAAPSSFDPHHAAHFCPCCWAVGTTKATTTASVGSGQTGGHGPCYRSGWGHIDTCSRIFSFGAWCLSGTRSFATS